jgi:hypothetical protein
MASPELVRIAGVFMHREVPWKGFQQRGTINRTCENRVKAARRELLNSIGGHRSRLVSLLRDSGVRPIRGLELIFSDVPHF